MVVYLFKKLLVGFFLYFCFIMLSANNIYSYIKYRVKFIYYPDKEYENVNLVGSFNSWNQTANPMRYNKSKNIWELELYLKPGEYQYKFLIEGRKWLKDNNADLFVDDGYGGENSVIIVDERFPSVRIRRGDGKVLREEVAHLQNASMFSFVTHRIVEIKLRTSKGDVQRCEIIYISTNTNKSIMEKEKPDANYDYFSIRISVNGGFLKYFFSIIDGENVFYYGVNGLHFAKERVKSFVFDIKKKEPFLTPDWVKYAVFYQIFPDRFYNGNPRNDPKLPSRPDGKPWSLTDSYLEDWETGKPSWANFFGGDLEGVMKKISYLKELGITAIYFNPIFKSPSNHKYDTQDYLVIDPSFGSNETFKQLVELCHQNGIRVIIDGVFNHTADEHWAFEDVKKRGKQSPYWDWYFIKRWPFPQFSETVKPIDYYECWWGFGDLPKLNVGNREVKEYIFKVVKYWMEYAGIDGWRLDVPNELPHWFWIEFRNLVKSINPDAYIVGEIWGSAVPWLQGDQFDAVMNYQFRNVMIDFFARNNINVTTFDERLYNIRRQYPFQVNAVMFNLLGSHDTERFLTLCGNDINRMMAAVFFQMTYIGAPVIFYGDEIGLQGGRDPDCRRPFIWNELRQNKSLWKYYKKLIEIRKKYPALAIGDFESIYIDNKNSIYWYKRKDEKNEIIIAVNNSPIYIKDYEIPSKFFRYSQYKDVFNNIEYKITGRKVKIKKIKPYKGVILVNKID